jgi:hypothetical protein
MSIQQTTVEPCEGQLYRLDDEVVTEGYMRVPNYRAICEHCGRDFRGKLALGVPPKKGVNKGKTWLWLCPEGLAESDFELVTETKRNSEAAAKLFKRTWSEREEHAREEEEAKAAEELDAAIEPFLTARENASETNVFLAHAARENGETA